MANVDEILDDVAARLRLVLEKERESLPISSIQLLETALAGIEEVRAAVQASSSEEAKVRAVRFAADLLRVYGVISDFVS